MQDRKLPYLGGMTKKNSRLEGLSRVKIAQTCSLEIYVGYATCRRVLWEGYRSGSLAALHVMKWADDNGIKLVDPKAPLQAFKGQSKPARSLEEFLAGLEARHPAPGATG